MPSLQDYMDAQRNGNVLSTLLELAALSGACYLGWRFGTGLMSVSALVLCAQPVLLLAIGAHCLRRHAAKLLP